MQRIVYLAAITLRLFNLGIPQLWYDETFTYLVSSQDLGAMFKAIAGDVHPPLYYLLISPIAHLGLNEVWLRLPSVVLSVLAIWLTGKLATQLGLSQRAGLIAQILVTLLPGQIYYAQEARMYALLTALVLGWLLMVLQRRWGLAALLGTLALYTHNYAVFYLLAAAFVAVDGELRRPVHLGPNNPYPDLLHWQAGDEANLKGAVFSVVVPALAWLPWQVVLLGQMANVAQGYWIQPVTPGGVIYALVLSFWSFYTPSWAILAALVTLTLLAWAVIRGRRAGPAWKVLMVGGFGPLLLAVAASLAWKPVLLYRGLIASVPVLCMLIGTAIDTLNWRKLSYVSAILLPMLLGGVYRYYVEIPAAKGLIYQDMTQLQSQWRDGDLLIHTNASTYLRWRAYAPDLPQVVLPTCGPNGGEISEVTRSALNAYTTDGVVKRLWVLWDSGPTTPTCEIVRAEALTNGTAPSAILARNDYMTTALYLIEAP